MSKSLLEMLTGVPMVAPKGETLLDGDDPRSYPGGGIGGINVSEESSVEDHDDGTQTDADKQGDVELDYDEAYGYPGTGNPPAEPYTRDDVRANMATFASQGYKNFAPVRDNAGLGHEDSFGLSNPQPPLLVAGADQFRRSVTLTAHPSNVSDIYISTDAGVFGQVSLQAFGRGYSVLSPGQTKVIRHLDNVYATSYDRVTPTTVNILSCSIERYERT